jgi:hypothetical protein
VDGITVTLVLGAPGVTVTPVPEFTLAPLLLVTVLPLIVAGPAPSVVVVLQSEARLLLEMLQSVVCAKAGAASTAAIAAARAACLWVIEVSPSRYQDDLFDAAARRPLASAHRRRRAEPLPLRHRQRRQGPHDIARDGKDAVARARLDAVHAGEAAEGGQDAHRLPGQQPPLTLMQGCQWPAST